MTNIYVASKKIDRAKMVMDTLRSRGHAITYDWTIDFKEEISAEKALAEKNGIIACDILIYLWHPEAESARYEAGMAMGLGKPVIVSGKSDSFFFQLPNIFCVDFDEQIVEVVENVVNKNKF